MEEGIKDSASYHSKFCVEYVGETPKLDKPVLVCGFPGSGFVGKLVLDYMIEHLKATPFANIFSSSFPPQVIIKPNGTLDNLKNTLYYCKGDFHDLVLLTGDAQPLAPESEYELSHVVLDLCCDVVRVQSVYAIAAYITGEFAKQPKVYGTGTSADVVEEFSKKHVNKMDSGSITGMNGLVLGAAKSRNIKGVCLLGETSGYVVDAVAAKIVLESLSEIVGFKIDMSELEKKAKETQKIIDNLEKQLGKHPYSEQMAQQQGTQQEQLSSQENQKLGYIS